MHLVLFSVDFLTISEHQDEIKFVQPEIFDYTTPKIQMKDNKIRILKIHRKLLNFISCHPFCRPRLSFNTTPLNVFTSYPPFLWNFNFLTEGFHSHFSLTILSKFLLYLCFLFSFHFPKLVSLLKCLMSSQSSSHSKDTPFSSFRL